jgi:hypothetical protein
VRVIPNLAEHVADAILYEGYLLYPYRASAPKNQLRWQVGLVAPRDYADATGADPWFMQTECLADIRQGATLTARLRGLHLQERSIERALGGAEWERVDTALVGGRQLIAFDEAVPSDFVQGDLPLDDPPREWSWPWALEGVCETELVCDARGTAGARIVRRRRPVMSVVRVQTERCGTLVKIRVRIENVTRSGARTLADRDAAVRQSLAGAHTMLAVADAAFVSLLETPPEWSALAASCVNVHTFPVLVGPAGSRGEMLSSPVILYDYPAVAPESPGDLCDATEIDELLMLRVRTLTDDEKREARATDDRAAQIIERCDTASADTVRQLHGAVRRYADPAAGDAVEALLGPPEDPPHAASLQVAGVRIGRGSRVRLAPARRADSLDICLAGRTATVAAVYRTLEDAPYIAVTLDDDPCSAAGAEYRRSLFFRPDEIVPLPAQRGTP